MNITITPGILQGTVSAIPSKSQAHRLLICAAFGDKPVELLCPDTNQDIEATAGCLRSLGAQIHRTPTGYLVIPTKNIPESATLNCRESGSTLRFLLPVAGALGVNTTFELEGRLPLRPLSPLWEEMERMGCLLRRPTVNTIRCQGKLKPGEYTIDGSVSSQFISGLLLGLSLLGEKSNLSVTGKIESRPYIEMTRNAITLFGGNPDAPGGIPFRSPEKLEIEGDWSNAAFWLSANALGSKIAVTGLDPNSPQGDRQVCPLLSALEQGCPEICAGDIPDLIPVLSVVAAAKNGATFTRIARLRLKESDRVETTLALLHALGGRAEATQDTLTVFPCRFTGGCVDAADDHRIAMAAAVAATVAAGDVTILGTEAVSKSYPNFWADYRQLGGKI